MTSIHKILRRQVIWGAGGFEVDKRYIQIPSSRRVRAFLGFEYAEAPENES